MCFQRTRAEHNCLALHMLSVSWCVTPAGEIPFTQLSRANIGSLLTRKTLLLHFNAGYQCFPITHFPSPRYRTACQEASFEDKVSVPIRVLPFFFSSLCQTKAGGFGLLCLGGLFWAWIL